MDYFEQKADPIPLRNFFKDSFVFYRRNISIFLPLGFIYGFSQMLADNIYFSDEQFLGLRLFIQIIINCIATIIVIYTTFALGQGLAVGIKEWMAIVRQKLLLFTGISLIRMFFVGLGFLAFFLPGLYLSTIFLFVEVIVIFEYTDVQSVFQKSVVLVHHVFRKVFSFLMIIISCGVLFILLFSNLNEQSPLLGKVLSVSFFVFSPVYMHMAITLLYLRIKQMNVVGQNSETCT
ncbi:MAG: hypothetical protein K8S27_07605 [Candidatus Omnitrophica bacterium]|nr:hypothetical protein [Candidatus Omnitrophota bacterium]